MISYKRDHTLGDLLFCVSFVSFNSFTRFIHVLANISPYSFLWLNNTPLNGYHTYYLSIYQFMVIWIVLPSAIISNASVDIHARTFLVDMYFHLSWK